MGRSLFASHSPRGSTNGLLRDLPLGWTDGRAVGRHQTFHPGPERKRTSAKDGRPWRDLRVVMNGMIWSSARVRRGPTSLEVSAVPDLPSPLFEVIREGVLEKRLRALADDLIYLADEVPKAGRPIRDEGFAQLSNSPRSSSSLGRSEMRSS